MKTIITVLILICSNTILACQCLQTASFDLYNYDASINVAEIRILEKLGNESDENEILNLNDLLPLQPIINDYTEFRIEINEVYKGNIDQKTILLKVRDKKSNCYWEPEVGVSYIFYMGESDFEEGEKLLQIEGCQRRLKNNSNNYTTEKNILSILKAKNNGKFEANQGELIENVIEDYISISGSHKSGKREGKWIVNEPIDFGKNKPQLKRIVLILKYRHGDLKAVKYSEPTNMHLANAFTRRWKFYYEEKLLIVE